MGTSVAFQLPPWYLPPPEPHTDESTTSFVSLDGSPPDTLIAAGPYFYVVHFTQIASLVQNLSQHIPNPRDPQDPVLHRLRFVAKWDFTDGSRHLGIVDTDIANSISMVLDSPTQREIGCFEMWLRAAYNLVVPFQSLKDIRELYSLGSQFSCHSWMGTYLDWLLPNIMDSDFWLDMRDPRFRGSHVKIAEDTKSRLFYHDALAILSVEFDHRDPHKADFLSMHLDINTITLATAVSQRRWNCVATVKSQLAKICDHLTRWKETHRSGSRYKVEIAVQELSALRNMPVNAQSPCAPLVTEIVFLSKIVDMLDRLKAHRLEVLEENSMVMDMVNDLRKFAKKKQRNGMKLDRYSKFDIITSEVLEDDIDRIFGPETQNQ